MVKSAQEAKSAQTRAARNATRRAFTKLPVNKQLAEKRELLQKMYARFLKQPRRASRMERIQKGEADPSVEELEGLMMGVQLKGKRADPD
jgi:tRNA/tmRNA/rRNA uracil-C5-methylase (TrmA/RlmC/RlmD family)